MAERVLADDLIVTMTRQQLRELVTNVIEDVVLSVVEQGPRAPELLTCKELAARIKRNPQRLIAWVKENKIPHVNLSPLEMRFVWDDVVARLKEMSAGIEATDD